MICHSVRVDNRISAHRNFSVCRVTLVFLLSVHTLPLLEELLWARILFNEFILLIVWVYNDGPVSARRHYHSRHSQWLFSLHCQVVVHVLVLHVRIWGILHLQCRLWVFCCIVTVLIKVIVWLLEKHGACSTLRNFEWTLSLAVLFISDLNGFCWLFKLIYIWRYLLQSASVA